MMKKLPNSTIQLISSTQVISSILSAVKELVENAIDAKADHIEIKLEDFGLKKIEVTDNGSGIPSGEEDFVAKAHYTSKLKDHQDLVNLKTLGFRGEAVHSLCSVSNLSFSTKTETQSVGKLFFLNYNGEIISSKLCSREKGTTICCENIFKNLPVRKKFYSAPQKGKDQLKKVEDILIAYGLICPNIHIVLKHNKSVILQKARSRSLRESYISIFGIQCFQQMKILEKEDKDKKIKMTLIVPSPNAGDIVSRKSNDRAFTFVNKRPVFLKNLCQTIKKHCREEVKCLANKYPIFVLDLDVPCSSVDVNIEPNKTQIMLENMIDVQDRLRYALLQIYSNEEQQCEQLTEENRGLSDAAMSNYISASHSIPTKNHIPYSDNYQNGEELAKELSISSPAVFSQDLLSAVQRTPVDECDLKAIHDPSKMTSLSTSSLTTKNDLVDSANEDCSMELFEVNEDLPNTHANKCERGRNLSSVENENCRYDVWPRMVNTANGNRITSIHSKDDIQDDTLGKKLENRSLAHTDNETPTDHVSQQRNLFSSDFLSNHSHSQASIDSFAVTLKTTESNLLCTNDIENQVDERKGEAAADDRMSDEVDANGLQHLKEKRPKSTEKDGIEAICSAEELDSLFEDDEFVFELKSEKENNNNLEGLSLTQMKIDSWSRGSAVVSERTKDPLQPVEVLHSTTSKRPNLKEIKAKNLASRDRKSRKLSIRTITSSATSPVWSRDELLGTNVHFSLEELRIHYSASEVNSQLRNDKGWKHFNVIGKVGTNNSWIVERQKKLFFLNPSRLQELLTFEQLMKKHELPAEELSKPVILNQRLVGGMKNWNSMEYLDFEKNQFETGSCISDKRITANGFKVRQRKDLQTGNPIYEITHMTTVVPGYGISGLKKILDLVTNQGLSSKGLSDSSNGLVLQSYRPEIVAAFFKEEAVRLARNAFNTLSREDITDLLDQINPNSTKDISCLHDRNIFYPLGN